MERLLRTISVFLAAFVGGQILPPDSVFIPLCLAIGVIVALIDCGLFIWTGEGLISNVKNSSNDKR